MHSTTTASEEVTTSENIGTATAPTNTAANADESVVSSELKALRQSSIAMSASQKEGATQIIKDWMSDGSPSDEISADDSNEEGE